MTTPSAVDASVRGTMRLLALAAFASAVSMRVCDAMLPRLSAEFDRPIPELAPVVTAFTVAYALFGLVHGPLGDRRGKLRVVGVAALVAALGSLGCALSEDAATLIAARFVVGAACAAIIPLALAWIGDSVDFAVRQRTLARFAAASIGGMIGGQVIGGLATDTLGWRAAFVVPMLLFAIAGPLIARAALRERAAGTARVAVGGVLAGYAELSRNRWARLVMIAVAFEGALTFGALAFVPSQLHLRFGLPLWHAGLVVAAYGIGGLAFAACAAGVIGRLGEARMAVTGGALLAAGFAGVAAAPGWLWAGVGCTLAGFGFTMLHNTLQTQATQAHPVARGTAIAGFVLCLFVGQSLGVALAASLGARSGFAVVFIAAGVGLALLGLLVARALARRRRALAGAGLGKGSGAAAAD